MKSESKKFFGETMNKMNLFKEMKENLRESSIPSLAPTSHFKKKRKPFKTETNLNSSKNKFNTKNKAEYLKQVYGKLPFEFKFYLQFQLKQIEFEKLKQKVKKLKQSKIRSTFGGSERVDKDIENLLDQMYSFVQEMQLIGN